MFDIGWVEMAVIAVLMIIVIGPKDLPKVLHTLGQWIGQARALARSFQENLDDMVRESGLDDVRKEIESVADYDIGGEITKAIDSDGKIAGALEMGEEEEGTREAEDTVPGSAPGSVPGETSGDEAADVAETPKDDKEPER